MANFARNAEASFGTYTLLLSIRNLAKNLAPIPGSQKSDSFHRRISAGWRSLQRVDRYHRRLQQGQRRGVSARRARADRAGAQPGWPALRKHRAGAIEAVTNAQAASHRRMSAKAQFTYATFHPGAAWSVIRVCQCCHPTLTAQTPAYKSQPYGPAPYFFRPRFSTVVVGVEATAAALAVEQAAARAEGPGAARVAKAAPGAPEPEVLAAKVALVARAREAGPHVISPFNQARNIVPSFPPIGQHQPASAV